MAIHKWTGLACTAFLLVICLTGLPLVFREELRDWLNDDPPYAVLPADAPSVDVDGLVAEARRRHPEMIVATVFIDDDEPRVVVWMAKSWLDFRAPESRHFIQFDARTGRVMRESGGEQVAGDAVLAWILHLHADLFVGLSGELLLGALGILFVVAIVSGAVLYGPFMRKLAFGTVRREHGPRAKWLDLHNLLGIVTLSWALVVGFTGVVNELTTPLFALWQRTDLRMALSAGTREPLTAATDIASLQAALGTVRAAMPGRFVMSVAFPGSLYGAPHHYLIWTKGETPLTARLFTPAMVDARTGELTAVLTLPWYLRALEVSRPLHFGDYGGLPLKVIWALLDLVTIVVLISGLYLWLSKQRLRGGPRAAIPEKR
ncbi:MAG: PepSY domain-containing protein [Proteobacteria bacterium]|nr:PepSY domain-containing protein [Pseudomonadota bacterium]